MAWVIPSVLRPCSPATGDSTSPSDESCQTLARSFTARGKDTPPQSWRRAWKRATWIRHLSARTYESSTAAPFVASWISSLAASPARTSPSPGSEPASRASEADSGPRWSGSFATWDRASSTWRTPQASLPGLGESSVTWPRSGSMRNGECWERPTLAPLTSETGSGYWPTPDATVSNGYNRSASGGASIRPHVAAMARDWPTPTAMDAKSSGSAGYPSGGGAPRRHDPHRRGGKEAMGDTTHARLEGRREGLSWPPGPDDVEGWAAWDGPQPAVRRDADGSSCELDACDLCGARRGEGDVDAYLQGMRKPVSTAAPHVAVLHDQVLRNGAGAGESFSVASGGAEASATDKACDEVRDVWRDGEAAASPPGHRQQAGPRRGAVPDMPHEGRSGSRQVGQGGRASVGVRHLRDGAPQGEGQDLLRCVSCGAWATERSQAVAFRLDRLRLLGNGVVPQQGAEALMRLIARSSRGTGGGR
jgi:hypothetical protein